jgi:ribosome-associated heat shock protein Hsp15
MAEPHPAGHQRVDRWLWFARIAKSRTLAQALIERGKVRVNRLKIGKASTIVKPGDVLTLSLGPRVVSVEILGIGVRRGPAPEAQSLYRDLAARHPRAASGAVLDRPVEFADPIHPAARTDGAGRPTKRDRRVLDKLRGRE